MNEEETELSPDWMPTAQEMAEYQARDLELARNNLHVILQASPRPLSIREIKDSCLHNGSTVDAAVRLEVSARSIREQTGRYSLV